MKKSISIVTKKGIDVNLATQLVNVASQFECNITARAHQKDIDLKSILGLMSLIIPAGDTIEVIADGSDAESAIEAIVKVLE